RFSRGRIRPMRRAGGSSMHRFLRWALWCAAAAAAAGFVASAAHGLPGGARYDPLEALILDRASRIAAGLPVIPAGSDAGAALMPALLGFAALRFLGTTGACLAVPALAAACFSHPDGLWFTVAGILHLAVHDRRRFFVCAPALAALLGGAHLALGRSLGAAYYQEAWNGFLDPMRFAPLALLRYVGSQLLGTFGVLTLAAVLAFSLPVRPWRGAVGLWTWGAFAALGAGIAATQSALAGSEAVRPAAFALALVGPISIQRVTQHLSAWPGSSRMAGQRVMLTALLLQSLTLLSSLSLVRGFR